MDRNCGVIMQTKFNLYPKEQLPENFKFPQSYIDLSSNMMEKINELEYFPWWFEDPDYENSEIEDSVYLYSKAIEKLTGVADLISFARDGDWAACFKLTDYSGNPRVYVHDLGNKDNKYECKDFDEWLAEEIKRAKEY